MTYVDGEPEARLKGPRFRTSVVVLVVGILVAIPGVIVFAVGFWNTVAGPTHDIPGSVRVDLGTGTYVVFEQTGHTDTYGPVTIGRGNGITIAARQVVVTGPQGRRLEVHNSTRLETIDRGSDQYGAAVEFHVPEAGRYDLQFETTSGQVMIQRPLGDLFTRRVPWLFEAGIGWLIAVIGVTMLIIGVFRRGRSARTAIAVVPTPAVSPAAWFGDPLGEHRLRYWDGHEWTDHTVD